MATTVGTPDLKRLPIALGYTNEEYIADLVMPFIPVPGIKFDWVKFDDSEFFDDYDTEIGTDGKPFLVEQLSSIEVSSIKDYAVQATVPQLDIDADLGYDPVAKKIMNLTEILMIAREKRVATMAQAAGNFANSITLDGTPSLLQFNDASSDPLKRILDSLDVPLIRPNTMVLSQPVYTALRRHPVIVEAIKGTGADQGVISKEQMAQLFEVRQVLVGTPRRRTSKDGQTPTLERIWNKNIALLHINPSADAQGLVQTWGFTAMEGGASRRNVYRWTDPEPGGREGVIRIKVTENCREIVASTEAGYLIVNAIA